MTNFWIVAKHTFISKLKTKSFLISTGIMIAIVLVLSNLTTIIDLFNSKEGTTIAVVDSTGAYAKDFEAQLKIMDETLKVQIFKEKDEAIQKAKHEEFEGVLMISDSEAELPTGMYQSDKIADERMSNLIHTALTEVKKQKFTTQMNLTKEQLQELYAPAQFKVMPLSEGGKTESGATIKTASELNAARGLVYVMLFVIYFIVLGYAGMIASEIASEKTSRVMEILVSSISPVKQMFAKILGIACLSLVQMGTFLLVGYFSVQKLIGNESNNDFLQVFGFDGLQVSTVIYAVIFAMLGYLFYATMAAFLGSLVSRVEDIQPMITPMTMLVVIAFIISVFGLANPDTTFIQICSFIPPFTPLIMFLRVGMLDVPVWEIVLSLGLLIASIALLAIIGAKIYRGGVLMYGKGTSLKDLKQALALGKKEN